MNQKTKSPIKNPPLREPGQSLAERMQYIVDEKVLPYLITTVIIFSLAVWELFRLFFNLKPSPITASILALAAIVSIVIYVTQIKKRGREYKQLRLGRDGEIAVGQYLEELLAAHGCHVLHDIPGNGFNIDHVIIGPTGIFCIETKTISKPVNENPKIRYDGEKVTVNGFVPDRDPITQVKASARWLCDLIKSSTGKSFYIQPIVVFPDWFVEKMPPNIKVWVLNKKVVPTFIQNAKNKLSTEDISMIFFHLKQYVISTHLT